MAQSVDVLTHGCRSMSEAMRKVRFLSRRLGLLTVVSNTVALKTSNQELG